ncbi:VWA domain-containing protein [uncultured Dokdonia sp.]|uniref:VWA domain-containing protein n=1 Tax=uncultured Dokdonia sp. TaxID=575653 RepID=UPI0030EF9981|tara:strand:+ start:21130 stop:23001 length:1872 start_codon:yes stop_codon:yes gene_type:complete
MKHSNSEIFTRFIKFGTISTEKERTKITEIIQDWIYVPVEMSNISKTYLEVINSFITDDKISSILKSQPHLKNEFIKELFQLLERIETNIVSEHSFKKEEKLLEQFDKLPIGQFDDELNLIKDSSILDKSQINNYKSALNFVINEKKNTKVKEFYKLHGNIAKQWDSLIKKQYNTAIGQQLLKANTASAEHRLKENFDSLKIEDFKAEWANWNTYKDFLKKKYKKQDFDINKYQREFESIIDKEVQLDPDVLKSVKSTFIDQWSEKLSLEKLQQNVKIIDETRSQFLEELYIKIDSLKELLKVLTPFIYETADLGRLWNMSTGNWKKLDFNLLEEYAQKLKENKDLREISKLLGKFRKAEAQLEEEEFEDIEVISRLKINHFGKSDLIGITESDDLNNLLPVELALFSDIETESIFYKRFAEKRLQTFRYVSEERDYNQKSVDKKRAKEIEKDKGPFIIAVDTSGSMNGAPEFLAKIMAFAITKIAVREKRKAFLISFSTNVETFELTNIKDSLVKLIDFLQMSFHGGTDASEAVLEAINQMKTADYKKSDLLIITDGIFGNLDDDTLDSIESLKKSNNNFNSLVIGNSYNKKALGFCDNVWQYDPRHDELKDLIVTIKTMNA